MVTTVADGIQCSYEPWSVHLTREASAREQLEETSDELRVGVVGQYEE